MGGNYVGIEAQVFVVCVFIASVPLMAHGFNCKMGVIDFIHKIKDAERGKGN